MVKECQVETLLVCPAAESNAAKRTWLEIPHGARVRHGGVDGYSGLPKSWPFALPHGATQGSPKVLDLHARVVSHETLPKPYLTLSGTSPPKGRSHQDGAREWRLTTSFVTPRLPSVVMDTIASASLSLAFSTCGSPKFPAISLGAATETLNLRGSGGRQRGARSRPPDYGRAIAAPTSFHHRRSDLALTLIKASSRARP
jgi:hypothetical protein